MLKQFDLMNANGVPILREKTEFGNYPTCSTPEEIVNMLNAAFDAEHLAEEHTWAVAFNTQLKPIGIFELSHGTVNASLLSPREIMIRLCLCGAVTFIMAHNHPSGIVSPSDEDLKVTERIQKAGEIMNIRLLDHIIVADHGGYCSLKEYGVQF